MAHTVAHKLATDVRFQMAFLLLGVAISVPAGLITGKLYAATLVVSIFVLAGGLCKLREERSPNR